MIGWIIGIYCPSTKPSIKICTCVNKQKNSGSRQAWDNYITRCHRWLGSVPVGVGVSWGIRCQHENQLADWGLAALSDPQLSNPSQDEGKVLYTYSCMIVTIQHYSYLVPKASLSPHSIVSNLSEPRQSKIWPIKIVRKKSLVGLYINVIWPF